MRVSKTAAVLVSMLVLTTGSAAQAAGTDVGNAGMTPANPFYFVEQFSESMALAVAKAPVVGSPELEAKVRANQASERLAEARKLAEMNRSSEVEEAMNRYRSEMNRSMELASQSRNEDLKRRLGNATSNQEKVLEEVKTRVPEQAQKGIETAIENNRRGRERLEVPGAKGEGNLPSRGGPPETGNDEGTGIENVPEQENSSPGQLEDETDSLSDKNGESEQNTSDEEILNGSGVEITGGAVKDSPGNPGAGGEGKSSEESRGDGTAAPDIG